MALESDISDNLDYLRMDTVASSRAFFTICLLILQIEMLDHHSTSYVSCYAAFSTICSYAVWDLVCLDMYRMYVVVISM